jgi:hypothetical protein
MALLPEQTEIAEFIGYKPVSNEEDDQPYPIEMVAHSSKIRPATATDEAPSVGWPMYYWRGGWHRVPSMGEVEEMVFDSVCSSIDWEDEVEPDAPSSWLTALGMI